MNWTSSVLQTVKTMAFVTWVGTDYILYPYNMVYVEKRKIINNTWFKTGLCECDEDWFGLDCSLHIHAPPHVEIDCIYCRPCELISITGQGFIDVPSLACRFTQIQVVMITLNKSLFLIYKTTIILFSASIV